MCIIYLIARLNNIYIQVSDRAAEVKSLLNMTKGKEALKVALQNPPVGSKDPSVKVRGQSHSYVRIVFMLLHTCTMMRAARYFTT